VGLYVVLCRQGNFATSDSAQDVTISYTDDIINRTDVTINCTDLGQQCNQRSPVFLNLVHVREPVYACLDLFVYDGNDWYQFLLLNAFAMTQVYLHFSR
jgi:hypothetical protein